MKNLFLLAVFSTLFVLHAFSQEWGTNSSRTDSRDNAGLQGNQGAKSGFYETSQPVNFPAGASSWWHLLDIRHSNPGNNFAMQFAGSFYDSHLWFRKTSDNPAASWSRVVLEMNGSVGIGTTSPRGIFQVTGERDYLVNRLIQGATEDTQGINYLLLHKMSFGALSEDRYVMGNISAVRGGVSSWNRKWAVNVNTASAYDSNRGSIVSYMEAARLVTLKYNGERYIAIEIENNSTLYAFSFTGYAYDEMLQLVYDDVVSEVQEFQNFDTISIQGNVGIGTKNAQGYKLAVGGGIIAESVKVKLQTEWPDYAFDENYRILTLPEIEKFVKDHRHLPDIPSADEIKKEGLDLGILNAKMLKKIEDLTLILIEKDKQLKTQEERISRLEMLMLSKSQNNDIKVEN